MSRIGKNPIEIPGKVQVTISEEGLLKAKGPKGELEYQLPQAINYNLEGNTITFGRDNEDRKVRALHGLARALSANVIEGVANGFAKTLLIEGVGYKAEMRGNRLFLSLGFSHPVLIIPPAGIEFETPKPTIIIIKGIDKQLVGQVAATVRKLRKPEPYKGKGIRYEGEYIRRKAGKTAA